MRLEHLRLERILRFHDAVSVDFTALPPGLIAVRGANGEGKSGLLEGFIASLYRRFPSRGGSLVDYAHDNTASIESRFAVDGQGVYRARVALNGVRRTSEAVLERMAADGTREILTDGKVATFDAYVRDHFPPLEVLLASAFAAQNRAGSFATLDRKGRKDLFSQLLGLAHYETMAATARQAGLLLTEARRRLETERDVLARTATRDAIDDLARDRAAVARDLADAKQRSTQAAAQIRHLDHQLLAAQALTGNHRAAVAALDALEAERERLTREEAAITRDRTRLTRRRAAALEAIERDLAGRRADLDERITNNQDLVRRGDAIRAAAAELSTLDAERARVVAALTAVEQRHQDAVAERASLSEQLQTLKALTDELARAERAARLMGDVPCRGEGPYASCQFLVDAKASEAAVDQLRAKIDALPVDLVDQIAILDRERELHTAGADTLQLQLVELETKRQALAEFATERPALEAAQVRLAELAADQQAARQSAETQRADLETSLTEQFEALDERRRVVDERRTALDREEAQHRQVVADTTDAMHHEVALTAQLAEATDERNRYRDNAADYDARLRYADAEIASREARLTEVETLTARIETLGTDLVGWEWLARALGREGLPVLEIDAAGPTVSTYCNELLESCFGTRFSIELITQEAKRATGKQAGLKEAFSIRVYDNERGGEPRDIGDLSGGEQIIVDEALKAALAVFVNTRSRNPMQTLFRDETTAPLDEVNSARYVAMLRRLQTLAGYHQVIYVTHNTEAAALADAQLVVGGGTVTPMLPPFNDAV
jgi:DNA repair protein SbcC/Rad50